jgi:hypothetical protein
MKWAEAVRAWNAKHNAGGKYRIPAKGTPAYEQVREMMGSEAPKASVPKAPRTAVHHDAPAVSEEKKKHAKMSKVLEFLREVAKKHKAEKAEMHKAEKAEMHKEEHEKKKMAKHGMLANMEESLKETLASAVHAPPIRRKKLLEDAVKMKREISKLKKEMKA